jgi:hypothetical protein
MQKINLFHTIFQANLYYPDYKTKKEYIDSALKRKGIQISASMPFWDLVRSYVWIGHNKAFYETV